MRRALGLTSLSIFGADLGLRGYYYLTDQEIPYYDPYKAFLRSSRITLAGLRMIKLYTPAYKSTGISPTIKNLIVLNYLYQIQPIQTNKRPK